MKNKIICLVLSAVLLVGLAGANGAYAWFSFKAGGSLGGIGGQHIISTGNVGYLLYGNFSQAFADGTIVPEEELLSSFDSELNAAEIAKISLYPDCKMFIESTSTIDTQLRIKIVYEYGADESESEAEFVYDNAEDSPLTVDFTDDEKWSYDSGYFYYGVLSEDKKYSEVIPAFDVTQDGATPEVIPLFNSIRYSGENTESNKISGKELTVTVVFEARQSEFVDWESVGEIKATESSQVTE